MSTETASEVDTTNPGAASPPAPEGTEGTVTVTIDGVPTEVTQTELVNGFMRQADYTRKTTNVANQQKELDPYIAIKEAFDTDAATAMQLLGKHYGVPVAATQAPLEADDPWSDTVEATDVAVDPEIADLKAQVAALTNNQYQATVNSASTDLVERHPDADPEQVRRHAEVNGFPSLESAYRDLHWEDRNSAYQAQQVKTRAEQEIIAEKKAAGFVAPGSGQAVGSVTNNTSTAGMSFADVLRQEMKAADFDPMRQNYSD
jgi:sulfite reductase alpha subunit-like flavoprotein